MGDKHRDSKPRRVRELETLIPKQDVSIKSLPSGLRELYRRRCSKSVRAKRVGGTKEKWPSKYKRTNTHMNSQKLTSHTQGLHFSAPDRVLELKEEDTSSHP